MTIIVGWIDIVLTAAIVCGGLALYFIRLESKLSKIMNDICWIKKILNSRKIKREGEGG